MAAAAADLSDRAAAVIVAAGRGTRAGGSTPKQFLDLGDRPLLQWSVEAFRRHAHIAEVIVVLASNRIDDLPPWLLHATSVVAGGDTRASSVRNGLSALRSTPSWVLVHDGARPFVTQELITAVLDATREGPVVPVLSVDDTVKRVDVEGRVVETLPRTLLRRAQTPQGFPTEILTHAHAAEDNGDVDQGPGDVEDGGGATDDALMCERLGITVTTIPGDPRNVKITTPEDISWARWAVESGLISRGD